MELSWRPPTRQDDEAWAALLAAIDAEDEHGETFELEDLADEWESVWARPERDATFVWEGRELVAFGWLKTQPGVTTQHRIACWGGVRPSHRGRGIGRALLGWQLERARAIATELDPALPVNAYLDALDTQHDLLRLASRLGFTPMRRFLDLARPLAAPLETAPAVPGLDLVPWSPALDDAARLAHRDAFRDHWGSEPRGEEAWRQWYTGHRGFRPDLSVLGVEPQSRQVVGLALVAAYPQDWHRVPVEAWVTTLGTRRARRGRGVARWLLTEALVRARAAGDGFERAILGVDSANPTGALELYRSLGFREVRATTTLGVELRPATAVVSTGGRTGAG